MNPPWAISSQQALMQPTINTNDSPVDITSIAFERINDDYYWGQYGSFRVIIQMRTGYINVTHLCGLARVPGGQPKRFRNWIRSEMATNLVEKLAARARQGADALLVKPPGLPNELRGTYAHIRLVPHIASWACPEFTLEVSDIVNAYMERKHLATIAAQNVTIGRQQTEISRLESMVQRLMHQTETTHTKLDTAVHKIDSLTTEVTAIRADNVALHEDNTTLITEVTTAAAKIDTLTTEVSAATTEIGALTTTVGTLQTTVKRIAEERVPTPIDDRDAEIIIVFARPLQPGDTTLDMKFKRIKKQSLSDALKSLAKEGYTSYAGGINPTPNAVDIGTRFRHRLRAEMKKPTRYVTAVSGGTFSLRATGENPWRAIHINALLKEIDAEKRNVGAAAPVKP